jgi:hypothetical protein
VGRSALPAAIVYLWWQSRAIGEVNRFGIGRPIVFRRRAILLPNVLFIDLLDHHAIKDLHDRFAPHDRFLGGRLVSAWLTASLSALGLMGVLWALLEFGGTMTDAEPRILAVAGLGLGLALAAAALLAARIVFTVMRGDRRRTASELG